MPFCPVDKISGAPHAIETLTRITGNRALSQPGGRVADMPVLIAIYVSWWWSVRYDKGPSGTAGGRSLR